MEFTEYIKPELLILIPVLTVIGSWLKNGQMNDKYIPLTLGAISILLCVFWVISNSFFGQWTEYTTAIFTAITQGVLIAGASVYGNEIIKQLKKED